MRHRHVFVAVLSVMALTALVLAGCSSEDSPTDPNGGDPAGPAIWYVDIDAMGTGDGKSWDNAFNHPSDAMAAASSDDQIWVADGIYYGTGDKSVPVVAFKAGVKLYGGFRGGELNLADRDMADRATFSGGDTLYHVVTGADNALLHGIIVRNGNAIRIGDISNERGGGIYCYEAKMRISNCIIDYNEAGLGGGIFADGDTITVDTCTIANNHANDIERTGTGGGGINLFTADAVIDHCTVRDNTSDRNGGGMLIYRGKAVVTDSEISGNSLASTLADGGGVLIEGESGRPSGYMSSQFISCRFVDNMGGYGGAVRASNTSPHFEDCEFEDNDAGMIGAALYGWASSFLMERCVLEGNGVTAVSAYQQQGTGVPRIFNCLFIFNGDIDSDGGALRIDSVDAEIECCTIASNNARNGGGIISTGACSPVVNNCILWFNNASMTGDQIYDVSGATTTVTYTDIDQDGFDGAGLFNLRSDPIFVAGPRGNHYLSQIAAGQPFTSPCFDVGSDTAVYFSLNTMTTRTDNVLDAGQVDLGFHYEPDN